MTIADAVSVANFCSCGSPLYSEQDYICPDCKAVVDRIDSHFSVEENDNEEN